MAARLYAWATPAFIQGSPADHTWVTTYDSRLNAPPTIGGVTTLGEDNWYCWGSFHPSGHFLGSKTGNLALARCLVQPNVDSNSHPPARGTIFSYGIDGVCHQLANQVLYATKTASTSPLTVSGARWYSVSVFFYDVYGLQYAAFAAKLASCSGTHGSPMMAGKPTAGSGGSAAPTDTFQRHVRKALGPGEADKASALQQLREEIQADAEVRRSRMTIAGVTSPEATAAELNARNREYLKRAAEKLGREGFIRVFGFSPDETVNLVDPAQFPAATMKA